MKKIEENVAEKEEKAESAEGAPAPSLGKFKSVDALLRAYSDLEAEFTRRSQKIKALEGELSAKSAASEKLSAPQEAGQGAAPLQEEEKEGGALPSQEELYLAVMQNEGVKARVLSDYLSSLKGVPLLSGTGAGVSAPASRPKTIAEAGKLALGYFKSKK